MIIYCYALICDYDIILLYAIQSNDCLLWYCDILPPFVFVGKCDLLCNTEKVNIIYYKKIERYYQKRQNFVENYYILRFFKQNKSITSKRFGIASKKTYIL